MRVQTVISQLGGEKIDIIEWSEDHQKFVAAALSPAKVQLVEIDEAAHIARAQVNEDQLSLAIGRGGQNVRLAVKLTGWKIDIIGSGTGEVQNIEGEVVETGAPAAASSDDDAKAAAPTTTVGGEIEAAPTAEASDETEAAPESASVQPEEKV